MAKRIFVVGFDLPGDEFEFAAREGWRIRANDAVSLSLMELPL
jgi:hypothetical protein